MLNLKNLRGGWLTGYQDFVKRFRTGTFVSSKNISAKYDFVKALASLYIFPCFFKGIYYIPTMRERNGHFVEKPSDFFRNLFDFAYGRNQWYWSLSSAARYYGTEWSSTKIIELVTPLESKIVNISSRIDSLEKRRSYRSRVLSRIFSSLEINMVIIHKGKKDFLKCVKIDGEIGPVATRERFMEDVSFFLSKTRIISLRRLYKKYLAGMLSEVRESK